MDSSKGGLNSNAVTGHGMQVRSEPCRDKTMQPSPPKRHRKEQEHNHNSTDAVAPSSSIPNSHQSQNIETKRSVVVTPDDHGSPGSDMIQDNDEAHAKRKETLWVEGVKSESVFDEKMEILTATTTNNQNRCIHHQNNTTDELAQQVTDLRGKLAAQQEEHEKKLNGKEAELVQQVSTSGKLVQRVAELEQQLATQREEYEKNLDAKEVELVRQVVKNRKVSLRVAEFEKQLAAPQEEYDKNLDAKEAELVQQTIKNAELAQRVAELEGQLVAQQTAMAADTMAAQSKQGLKQVTTASTTAESNVQDLAARQNTYEGRLAAQKVMCENTLVRQDAGRFTATTCSQESQQDHNCTGEYSSVYGQLPLGGEVDLSEYSYTINLNKDVVSGRGGKVTLINRHFQSMVYHEYPAFDSTTSKTAKRKIGLKIHNTIIDRGGRFLDIEGNPMQFAQSIKKVMSALKNAKIWRAESKRLAKKKRAEQCNANQEGKEANKT